MNEIQFDVADKFLSDDCTALYCNAEEEIRFLNASYLYRDKLFSLILPME